MYLCMYIYIHVCLYIYICIHIYIWMCVFLYVWVYIQAHAPRRTIGIYNLLVSIMYDEGL